MTDFRKELLLVVTGAIIALTSALLSSVSQAHFQTAQALSERRLKLLGEVSVVLGEGFANALIEIKLERAVLSDMKETLDAGFFATNEQVSELNRHNDAFGVAMQKMVNTLPGQTILLQAVFGEDGDGFDMEIGAPTLYKDAQQIRRQMDSTNDYGRQLELKKQLVNKMDVAFADIEKDLQQRAKQMNEHLISLAKKVN